MKAIKSLYKFISSRYQTVHLDYRVEAKPRYGHGRRAHEGLEEIISSFRDDYQEMLKLCFCHVDYFQQIPLRPSQDAHHPHWINGFLPGLDIVALHTIIGKYRLRRYIEIGSGNSTKVAKAAIEQFDLDTEILSIDPYPRAEIDHLADKTIRLPY